MIFQDFVFYSLASVVIISALGVITLRNPVYSVLLLVLAFVTSSGLWILLEAEFLAIALVVVYVGAVMVLFLFVVMMLDINLDQMREGFWKWFPFGAILAFIMTVEMSMVLMSKQFSSEIIQTPEYKSVDYSNTKELGRLIYTEYVYVFELAAVILLVAMVAAIAITLRHRTDKKSSNASRQIAVSRNERLKVISMPAEKKE
ncbi:MULTISPECIES: NADH-quinone oxidoreductase subunit J [Nitrosomonas]|uniref:NADH-quinone oxidoreductase subunit J n=1 Tax=Nitrosomonas eutropha TaxID=916 RepID=A0ABX5MEC6_9PROT|nr:MULTISPECIES: NADH-quinone oxidoreductase subunit J [Nitrosomonas]MXS79245.1 NADH-quinone oxidoreductase subunit J [Nitrosomonas sp. GH22]PXV83445.1 NADH dehydrogenase subunit J [Nitrosomonas eutropha]SDW64402.1 NADH dehydrogenase subunit J [Nitrosomonas eutropha]SEI62884.1 NADH dehydrogenase subunit J [Nitrosomonas eutropha]